MLIDTSMTSKRSKTKYSSICNTYNNSNCSMPRSIISNRSQSPATIDAELTNLKMNGNDYHVSVNLNSILPFNQSQPFSRIVFNNFLNQQQGVQQNFDSLEQNNTLQNSLKEMDYLKPSINPSIHSSINVGSNRTILTINGVDDSDIYQLYHQNLLGVVKPILSPTGTISQKINSMDGSYAVKSISSNDTNHQHLRNSTVEFDLQLRGHVLKERPVQSTWEVVGTVPIQRDGVNEKRRAVTSRSGAQAINEDEDAVDATIKTDTSKELEDLLLSHPLIRDTPGGDVTIEKQRDQFIEPPTGPSEGMVNMDIIEERVELMMKNERCQVSIRVTCSRTVPLNNSPYFKKSTVVVIKLMDFDMTETDVRMHLYKQALRKQNLTPNGRLDQQETKSLYKALVKIVKDE